MIAAKRFWKQAGVVEAGGGGFAVHLDEKPIRTPKKAAFVVPTRALAEAVASEWDAQEETLDPHALPLTRYVNSVLDSLSENRAEILEIVSAYGETDLLCYRATHPAGLIARQSDQWDPLLDWARDRFDAPLVQVQGVMPATQPEASVARLAESVASHDDFELAALHDLVAISGSLVLGLAVSEGRLGPDEAWALSRLDEDWQTEQWGEDAEAAEASANKASDFADAARFLTLVRAG